MWWLNAESPSGNAAPQVQSVEQISHSAEAVKQSQAELRARDPHILAQSEPLQGQRDLKQHTASSARQHESPHKVGETQSKLFVVIDRHQAQRVEKPRTSKESELQLAAPQSEKRELEAKLAELANLHALAQAKLNAKLVSLELELSEQQRALHEQVERSGAQVAELEVLHANRLTAELNAAQVAKYAAIAHARKADSQHAAAVEQLSDCNSKHMLDLEHLQEQIVSLQDLLAKRESDVSAMREATTKSATAYELSKDQNTKLHASLSAKDHVLDCLRSTITQLASEKEQADNHKAKQDHELDCLRSTIAQLASEKEHSDNHKAKQYHELDCLRSTIAQLASEKEHADNHKAKQDHELDCLRSTIAQLASEKEHSDNHKAKQDHELDCLRSTIAQLTSEKEHSDNHKAKQDHELDCLRSTIAQLASEKEHSDNHKAKQDDELDCLRSTITQLASEKEQADNHKAKQDHELDCLRSTIAQLTSEKEHSDNHKAKQDDELDCLRSMIAQLASEKEHSDNHKAKQDHELVCLRSTIAQLASEKEHSDNHKAKQDHELVCLRSTIAQLTTEKEQADNHKAKQDHELDCLRSTNAQLASEKEQADNHKAKLQAAFSDQQSEVSALSATIAKLEFTLGEQSIARQKLLDAAESTQKVFNKRLDSTNAKHTAQCQEMQETADQLKSTLAARESEVTDLKQLLVAHEFKLALLSNTHHQFIHQAAEKEQILRSQWRDCKELNAAQISKLRAANAQQQATTAKHELVISELQTEIQRNADARAELTARHEQEMINTQRANFDARVRQEQLQRQHALDVECLQLTIAQYEQSIAAKQNRIEELEAKLFDESEAREQLTSECTELNRALAAHRISSDLAEAAASTRLAEVQQQQAVEVTTLRSTLSLLESSLQNSSKEKEAAQAAQELAHRHQLAEIERQSAIQAAESEKALLKQLEPLTRKLAELQTRLDETLRAKREMGGAHAEECNSLRGERERLSCELQAQGETLNEALSELAETRSQLSSEQTLRRQAEADRADYSRCAEQSRNHATTWRNRLQKESAERRKAESALLRAADTADQETIARVAQAELDAQNRCQRLTAELVATRAVAANTQRRMVSEFKRAREEVVRLRSKLEIRQAAASTIPTPRHSEESVVEPMRWVTTQSKAS